MNYYNYFTEIEETFIRRRGKNLLLSPLDWALIEDWQERGIPLHIVIRSIESVFDVFDKQPIRPRTIKSLFYCREEIEVQYKEWLTLQAGAGGEDGDPKSETHFSEDAVSAHIKDVRGSLENSRKHATDGFGEVLDRVIARLDELTAHREDPERLEKSLDNLDGVIDQWLLESAAAGNQKKEIERQLATYKKQMDSEAYDRTFELMLIKRLREHAGIPRLSLFHL